MIEKLVDFGDLFTDDTAIKEKFDIKTTSKKDIAIIGANGRFADANNLEEYWEILSSGKCCITTFPENRANEIRNYMDEFKKMGLSKDEIDFIEGGFLTDIDKFDCDFFNISQREADLMDPNQRLFLQSTWNTIYDAGYSTSSLKGTKTGVYVGFSNDFFEDYKKYVQKVDPDSLGIATAGNIKSIIASRISYLLNFKGPSVMVDTACSSSLVAIHLACQAIRNGECEMAIAGGVKVILTPVKGSENWGIGIQSSDYRAKTFDSESDGTGLGEGVGTILLKPLYKAINDGDNIYAVIKGTAVNQDGNSAGLTTPNPRAQEEVIVQAWKDAKIDLGTVSYIEAHGTGTKLGDPIEINGIQRALRRYTNKKQFCAVGAVKTNIGHLDSAAGIAGVIKIILSIKKKKIPASLHFQYPNLKINFEDSPVYVNDKLSDWKREESPLRCGISSFGLSGTNCHIVIEEPEEITHKINKDIINNLNILTISAKSKGSLIELSNNYYTYITELENEEQFTDILFTINVGRDHFNHRIAILFNSKEELLEKLEVINNSNFIDSINDNKDMYYGKFKIIGHGSKDINNGEIDQSDKNLLDNECSKLVDELTNSKFKSEDLWKKICSLYIKGADVEWKSIYKEKDNIRISIPTYSFVKNRCWVDKNITEKNKNYFHPLLEEKLVKSNKIEIYNTKYNAKDFWVLSEHEVNGKYVIPGATYLEIARAACSNYFNEPILELEDFIFLSPFMMDYEDEKSIHTIIKENNNECEVSFVSKSDDDNWITHAEGRVRGITDDNKNNDKYEINLLKNKFNEEKEIDYYNLPPSYIKTGERWNNLKKVYIGENEVLGEFKISDQLEKDLNEYPLHPALIDVAMNVLIRNVGEGLYLPWSYKKLRIFNKFPREYYSYIKVKNSNEITNETATFDIDLIDRDGNIFVQVKDYTVKKVHKVSNKFNSSEDFYKTSWVEKNIEYVNNNAFDKEESIIILKSENDISNEITKEIVKYSSNIIQVSLGTKYDKLSNNEYIVTSSEEDFIRLFNDVKERNVNKIFNLMSLKDNRAMKNINELEKALDRGIYSLFNIAKALLKSKVNNLELIIVANNGISVTGEEKIINPHNASLYGLAKVISNEYSNIKCKSVDIDELSDNRNIIFEVIDDNKEQIVSYRNNKRFVEEFDIFNIKEVSQNKIDYKDNGVYIITGGTGGLGIEIAKRISLDKKVNLALITRGEFPDRKEWQSILNQENDNKLYRKIKEVQLIEKNGTTVEFYSCDISCYEDMKDTISKIKDNYSKINGVIHAAGVAGDGFIITKDKERFDKVIRPKIQGTWIIDNLTQDQELDFFIGFSSINTLFGVPGQGDYTAANSYLDSYSEMNAKNRMKVINWSAWKETGMAVDYEINNNDSIFKPLSTSNAIRLFDEVVERDIKRVIAGNLNYDYITTNISDAQINLSNEIKTEIQKRLNISSSKSRERNTNNVNHKIVQITGKAEDEINEIDKKLADIWGNVLGRDTIGVNDSFNELGGDSILATYLLRALESEFEGYIDISDIFTYSSLAAMSKYLDDKINKKNAIVVEESEEEVIDDEDLDYILEQLAKGELDPSQVNKIISLEGDE
ncbi:SDR family NAD(P)-dependent oxidoreductase [Clostridium sp. LP20]|uniref:SDR family NAD(P)-dependent oxidoreductase n=1 Tax=Clostridium sp. LP20 TaxID=3418665 RepID=UPI003EE49DFF